MKDADIEAILAELRASLSKNKCFGGEVSIEKKLVGDDRRATILFEPQAWTKMTALISKFGTEVQWHGTVRRTADNEFVIYDILVPPHVVTGTTVTSDPAKYAEWINALPDDVFNDLRFHGHSHVNMACDPSGTDTKYREDVVTQLPIPTENEDSFYIFLILNKRGEWTGEIYDIKNNAQYSTKEIDIDVLVDDGFLSDFVRDAKSKAVQEIVEVKTKVFEGKKKGGADKLAGTLGKQYSQSSYFDDNYRSYWYGYDTP